MRVTSARFVPGLFACIVCHAWLGAVSPTWAWVSPELSPTKGRSLSQRINSNKRSGLLVLQAGGFGGGKAGKAGKSGAKKEVKLKPKAQWDRFQSMKGTTRVRVAVRVRDSETEWLPVGHVKSINDAYTAMAVARQRALIAEHAKRLFPLQVSIKDTVEWGYWQENDNDSLSEWVIVDKAVLEQDDVPADLDKIIGFEGRPDPSTGYYCVYNEGRIVNDGEEARPSSKKLK